MSEFQKWPSIPRLFRDITITEKIDGTNAAIGIIPVRDSEVGLDNKAIAYEYADGCFQIYAQSRKRIITPDDDNFGFARWVQDNSSTLIKDLGEGLHFGEWWGSGIQRGYGLLKGEKRFSLFNTKRHGDAEFKTPGLGIVPILYEGPYSEAQIKGCADVLNTMGSKAAMAAGRRFKPAEGVVIYHHAANHCFKYTPFEKEDGHKGG